MRVRHAMLASLVAVSLWAAGVCQGQTLSAPPRPAIPPSITYPVDLDSDLDHVDDAITALVAEIRAQAAAEPDAERRAAILQRLQEPVEVEMLFAEPITDADLAAFVNAGGTVDHVFSYVSYGWGGKLPLITATQIAPLMGQSFLAVLMSRPVHHMIDEATRTGRVRPVWAPGFAGSTSGFTGSPTTSIAIIDMGLDGTHTDLAGRMRWWKDWVNSTPTPVDYDGHGTLAAAVALGTGAAAGVNPPTLSITASGDASSLTPGYFFPAPLHLPATSDTMSLTARWLGGGRATLGACYAADGSSSYTIIGSTVTGTSPLSKTVNFTGQAGRRYTPYFTKSSGTVTSYAVSGTVTYAGVGDGFNAMSGVAPGCWWVGEKVFGNDGSGGNTATIGYAIDECVGLRTTYNIKVMNISLGTSQPASNVRNKVNTAVTYGIVATVAAGNDGPSGVMYDPARARLAITAVACNDVKALTEYSSTGVFAQEANTDYKPDLCAPGGSAYYSYMYGADSNQSDAESQSFADVTPNDYTGMEGTSFAAPFVAGGAALVIQALEARGLVWDFGSETHPRLVKMLLCATATETNASREGGVNNPTLGRAAAPKDQYEGYGAINCDAAVEAAYQTMAPGDTINGTTAGGPFDRRAWARNIALSAGSQVQLALTVPSTADYDLYLYSGTPDLNGNPVILASSTQPTSGTSESISYTPASSGTGYVVVKRISGNGTWSLTFVSPGSLTVTAPNGGETWPMGSTQTISWSFTGSPGDSVKIELLKAGSSIRTIADAAPMGSGGSGSYSWAIPTDLEPANDYRIRVTSVQKPGLTDDSNANFTIARAVPTLTVDPASGSPGENIVLRATLVDSFGSPLSARTLDFSVEGTGIGSADTGEDGSATLAYSVPDTLGGGAKTLSVTFAGDTLFDATQGTAVLTINPAATSLSTADCSGTYTTTVTLRQFDLRRATDNAVLSGKTVAYRIDGTQIGTAQTDASGNSELVWRINEGAATRTITVEFTSDSAYQPSSATATLTVLPGTPLIWVANTSVYQSYKAGLYAYFRALPGSINQAGKTVRFSVDGTAVGNAVTDSGGAARLTYDPVGLAQGDHTIRCDYDGDPVLAAGYGTGTLTVLGKRPYIWVASRSVNVGMSASLYAYFRTLPDYAEQAGKTLTFKVDGTPVATGVTDAHGVVRCPYDTHGMAQGTHTIRCEFAGDAAVAAGYGEAPLTILAAKPCIWVADRMVNVGMSASLYAYFRTLPDYIEQHGKTVKFKVDGTLVATIQTDQHGVARGSYDTHGMAQGTHTIRCEFAGDASVAAGYGEAPLTILPAKPYIWVADRTVRAGTAAPLYAYFRILPDLIPQPGKIVTFKIDGTPVATVMTDGQGVARYQYDTTGLAIGAHVIRCQFSGDSQVAAGYGDGTLTID